MNSTLSPFLVLSACVAIASSIAAPAQAFTLSIDPVNNQSTENTGSSALLDFNFVQDGANVKLNLGIKNTTNGTLGLDATQATLVGVGFDLSSLIQSFSYSANNSTFTSLYNNATLNPYGTFDVGIRSAGSGNFSGGNPTAGLTAGNSTLVSFLLQGSGLTASSVETSFYNGFKDGTLQAVGRFQQVNAGGGSDKVLGSLLGDAAPSVPSTGAPEPSSMLGLATVGAVLLGRKKLKSAEKLSQVSE